MESRKFVLKETAIVLLGEILCTAAMLGVYALLQRFDLKVLLGGAAGCLLATANFFFMAVGASLAADKAEKSDVKGGKAMIQSSYFIRLAVLAVVIFACAKSGWFNLLALLIPLLFVRPVLTVSEFFRKAGDPSK